MKTKRDGCVNEWKLKLPTQADYEDATEAEDGYELVDGTLYREEFQTLFNTYCEELGTYNPWLLTQKDENGNYLSEEVEKYFSDPKKTGLIVMCEQKIAGFVVLAGEDGEDGIESDIEEMYIVPWARGKRTLTSGKKINIASDIAKRFWRQNEGLSYLFVLPANLHAVDFWERAIREEGYKYQKVEDKMVMFCIYLEERVC